MKYNKFRVWDKKGKVMSYNPYYLLSSAGLLFWMFADSEPCLLAQDDFEVMFYIGLKGNGKEIYHEDILMVNNKNYDPSNYLYYEGRVLVKKIEQLGFNLKPLDPVDEWSFDSTSMWHVGEKDTTEIIGNKFENPELMK